MICIGLPAHMTNKQLKHRLFLENILSYCGEAYKGRPTSKELALALRHYCFGYGAGEGLCTVCALFVGHLSMYEVMDWKTDSRERISRC